MSPSELLQRWREDAARFREYGSGGEALASVLDSVADQMEVSLRDDALRPLSLAQASVLGGYSVERLGALLRERPELNVGRKGAPRIMRSQVPFKAGHAPADSDDLRKARAGRGGSASSTAGAAARRAAL
ncbi:MAG TPA: hypothetical protein VF746_13185 [Longimicrobium sp.]